MSLDSLELQPQIGASIEFQPPADSLLEFLGRYDHVVTEERIVKKALGGINEVHETLRLSEPKGESIAKIEWGGLRAGITTAEDTYQFHNETPRKSIVLGGLTVFTQSEMAYANRRPFGSVWRVLGYHHARYLEPDSMAAATVWVIPSDERINYSQQNEFNRTPEKGYPTLITLEPSDEAIGFFKAEEFFTVVQADCLPVCAESKISLRIHDLNAHKCHSVITPEFFAFVKEQMKTELALPHDWDNLPQDGSASILMRSFDGISAELGDTASSFDPDNPSKMEAIQNDVSLFFDRYLAATTTLDEEKRKSMTSEFAEQAITEFARMFNMISAS